MRAFQYAIAQPWLLTPEALRVVLDVAARENVVTPEVLEKIERRNEALANRQGRRIDSTRYTELRSNGVAIISVTGVILRYADIFCEVSGATATAHLAYDFRAAIESGEVKHLILAMDTPGGAVPGLNEFAESVFAARGKGKRIIAYGDGGIVASAGYWIASACDEIVIDPTTSVGGLGIRVCVPNPKALPTPSTIDIVSTLTPKKDLDVLSDEGRSELQRHADEIADVFLRAVARNRGVSLETVISDFGQGGVRVGADAIKHRMADRFGSLEQIVDELGRSPVAPGRVNSNQQAKGITMSTKRSLTKTTANDGTATAPPPAEPKAGSGACSECDCDAFAASDGDPSVCAPPCGHADASHEQAAASANTEPTIEGLQKQLASMQASLTAMRTELQTERSTRAAMGAETRANAQVDEWERLGHISGNATAHVRKVYLAVATGKSIAAADVEAMVVALPKLNTKRVTENVGFVFNVAGDEAKPDAPTKEDFLAAERKNDSSAKSRIDAFVLSLVAADKSKTYTAHYRDARRAAFETK